MRTSKSGLGILVSLIAGSVFACSSASKPSHATTEHKVSADAPDSGSGQNPDLLGGGADAAAAPQDCTSGTPQGCPCAAGTAVACWTGPAADRNSGSCHDGTQACVVAQGEVGQATWGPCVGQVLSCDGSPDGDAGADTGPVMVVAADAATDTGPATVVGADAGGPIASFLVSQNATTPGGASSCSVECGGCVPGAVIGCYDDCNAKEYCNTDMTQTCQPNGTWGACTEGGTKTAQCWEFWGNCTDYNGGAGSYAGDCDSVFTGCASPLSTTCPGSTDASQVGVASPDTGAGTDGSMGGGPGGKGGATGTEGSPCMSTADCEAPLTCTSGYCLP